MVKNFAIIEAGKVVNLALSESALADNWIESNTAKIGDSYADGVFTTPAAAAVAPQSVTSVQALTALHNAGLLASVETLMANSQTDPLAVIAYQRATSFRRNSPFIVAVGSAMNLTEAQIDALFIAASQIE